MNKSDLKLIAVLERTGGFASAQELHQILRREGDGIGLTTVYRALQSLVDDKIVDLLRREDGEAIYRLCGDTHHHHLVCKSCGDTVEIEGGADTGIGESGSKKPKLSSTAGLNKLSTNPYTSSLFALATASLPTGSSKKP